MAGPNLIGELEDAVSGGSQERRIEIMRKLTALFVGSAEHFSSQQIELFGDVLSRLTTHVEIAARAELAAKLAPLDRAPDALVLKLARDDEIAVAGPVLSQSSRLSDADLIDIAKTKDQAHLGAISERVRLAAAVTDVLVDRGNSQVAYKLSCNQGASFSDAGFAALAKRAEKDERIAENLGARLDFPPALLRELVAKATATVRSRILPLTAPEDEAAIQEVIETVSHRLIQRASVPRDFSRAEALIVKMSSSNQLDEAAILEFANSEKYEEMVAGIARMGGANVELVDRLMQHPDYNGVLVACKAATLHWTTFAVILDKRFSHHRTSAAELGNARSDFLKLSVATAQRMLRFWIIRGVSNRQAGGLDWSPH